MSSVSDRMDLSVFGPPPLIHVDALTLSREAIVISDDEDHRIQGIEKEHDDGVRDSSGWFYSCPFTSCHFIEVNHIKTSITSVLLNSTMAIIKKK